MNDKALVFSDVDGTLYGSDFVVKEETVKHIHNAIDVHGIEFVLVTGNPPFARHQELAEKLRARFLITAGGATIFDNETKKYLYLAQIKELDQALIIKAALDFDLHLNFWNDEDYFTLNDKEEYRNSWNYSMKNPKDVIKNANKPQKKVVKMEFFGPAEKISQAMKALAHLELEVIIMRPEHIEITAKNSNKGTAIEWFLANVIRQEKENIMTIGDSPNDWPMFKLGCYSYAMDNAGDNTKKQAKYYTSAYNQNGVGLAIDDYLYRYKNIRPTKQ